jgi:hypothetical protein
MPARIVEVDYEELTPAQYGRKHGMGEDAVRARCKMGQLMAYQTEGGHWKIRDYPRDVVDRKAYESLLSENAELRAVLDSVRRLITDRL